MRARRKCEDRRGRMGGDGENKRRRRRKMWPGSSEVGVSDIRQRLDSLMGTACNNSTPGSDSRAISHTHKHSHEKEDVQAHTELMDCY